MQSVRVALNEDAIRSAWIQACADLGIDVVVPASVSLGSRTISALALLPEFGAPSGMVIFGHRGSDQDCTVDEIALVSAGYGYSYLGASYETYERDLFIDTMNDWGWSSATRPPPRWFAAESSGDGE